MWKFHRKKNQQISKHRNVKGIANRISGEKVEKFEISVQITRNNSNGTTAESWKKKYKHAEGFIQEITKPIQKVITTEIKKKELSISKNITKHLCEEISNRTIFKTITQFTK